MGFLAEQTSAPLSDSLSTGQQAASEVGHFPGLEAGRGRCRGTSDSTGAGTSAPSSVCWPRSGCS